MNRVMGWGALPIWIALLALSCGPGPADDTASTEPDSGMEPDPGLAAAAILHPTEGNETEGIVAFQESTGGIHVMAHVTGLAPGRYNLHVHENGDCSSGDGTSTGGIFNPDGSDSANAAGQLGEIEPDESGMAHFMTDVDQIALAESPRSVVGRAAVIMAQEGDASSFLACGVIEPQAPGAMREGSGF